MALSDNHNGEQAFSQIHSKDKDKKEHYCKLFQHLHNARERSTRYKKEDEEFYYGDVEETRSQFTQKQLTTIHNKYDIPISTKVNFAIVDQMLSFLTGTQPYLRVIANEERDKQWSYMMEKLQKNVWEESDVSQLQFPEALRDMIVTGSGYLIARKNNFFEETTFGVTIQHIPWTNVYVDPASKKRDLSDARTICIAERLQVIQAERKFGVTLDKADADESFWDAHAPVDNNYPEWIPYEEYRWKEKKWAWCKEFFELEEKFVFVSPEGYASLEAPTPTQIPNPEKQQAQQMYMQKQQQIQEQVSQLEEQAQSGNTQANSGLPEEQAEGAYQAVEGGLQAAGAIPQITHQQEQLNQLAQAIQQLPDMIPAYTMILENGEEKTTEEISKIKQKRVVRTMQIGKRIVETEILPTDQYPIHHFCFSHFRSPNRTFGITHYIKDIVKAMNKFWALMIYEYQLSGHGKWLVAESSVTDPNDFERKAAIPGAVLTYTADPSLQNGGRPEPVQAQPLNQGATQLLTMLLQLAEYVTGIFGVMQGNAEAAPATMGATQSLQSFGTQRIKLQARTIETTLSDLSYSTIKFLQKYCPQDVLAKTIDSDGNGEEGELLDINELTKFKCRTMLAQNLPTSRQMAATLLSTLAGQTTDPQVQQLLTQYSMKFLDIQEGDEISGQLDVIKQMQSQLQQAQEQNKNLEGQLKAATNNLAQKDVAMAAEKAKGEIANETKIAKLQAQQEAQQGVAMPMMEEEIDEDVPY